jgi:hypothetical protein
VGRTAARAKPWEKQPTESLQAFNAFVAYRDMGSDRTTRAVAAQLKRQPSQIFGWSTKHRWVSRAEAFELDLDARYVEWMRSER